MDYYTNQSYYDILGVKQDASLENIQKAKNRLKFGDSDDRAPFSLWDKIDEAYNVLSDSEKRREYDKTLQENIDIYSHSDHSSSLNLDSDSNRNFEDEQKKEELDNKNLKEEEKNNSETIEEFDNNETQEKQNEEDKNNDIKEEQNEPKKEYDLNYISEFNPKEKTEKTKKENSKAKNIAIGVAGTLIPFAGAAMLGVPALGLAAATVANIALRKKLKISLQKDNKPKKITKISTAEMGEMEKYNQTLNAEINRLLSEPHNNYKLEINRIKYENQIKLLERLLDIKLNKKVKKTEMLKQKLDVVSTKMQLETAKKNLVNVQEKIKEYEKEQGLSKVNKELIEVNQQLAEQKGDKSFSLRKLEAYQTKILNKRDFNAKRIKFMVEKSGKVYDSLLKAKDFAVSLPYAFKSAEKLDEFMSDELQKTH